MTFVKSEFTKNYKCSKPRACERSQTTEAPALATLLYVDWLPTGQWSAESPTCLSARITKKDIQLCRHRMNVDS